MAYFIFIKNADGIENTLYRIAENETNLNNLNINQDNYKIIQESQENFNAVKYGSKSAISYSGDTISYINTNLYFNDKESLQKYIDSIKNYINAFISNNSNHPEIASWKAYHDVLNGLNVDNIIYPLSKSLEQHLFDLGESSFHTLQIP